MPNLEDSVRLRFGETYPPPLSISERISGVFDVDRIIRRPDFENSQNMTASAFGWIAMTRNSDGVTPNIVPANERWTIHSCVVFTNTIEAITYVGAGVRRPASASGTWAPLTPPVQTSASGVGAMSHNEVVLIAGDEVGGLVYKKNAGVATFQIAYAFEREVVAE